MEEAHGIGMPEGFGTLLRQTRLATGLSIDSLAERAAVHRATLYRWESGTSQPHAYELEAVLNALRADEAIRRRAYLLAGLRRAQTPIGLDDDLPMPAMGELWRALRLRRGLDIHEVATH